jgi:bacterioferritin-associated ferredoxin
MIVCVCNGLGEAACRATARRHDCRTLGCVYRLQGARVQCGRCLPHMEALLAAAKGEAAGGGAGLSPPAPAAPER